MIRATSLALVMLVGCAHVEHGLAVTQRGLALVDVATKRAAQQYVDAVQAVRQWCSTQADPDACEQAAGVDDARVEQVRAAAVKAAWSYDDVSDGLRELSKALRVLRDEEARTRAVLSQD